MTPEELEAKRLADEEAVKVAAAADEEAAKIAAEAAVEPELDDDGNPIVIEKEPWMEEEVGEQDLDDPSKQVPVGKFVGLKKKLKGQISDRNEEIEKLKAENEALKLKPKEEMVLVRPKRDDFEGDEEFDEALDTYNQSRTTEAINRTRLEDQQKSEQQQAQAGLTEAVDSHYERAETLIEKSGIKPEIYQAADATVRQAVEAISPTLGDVIVNQVISILGEGSEKVLYYLGRNNAALAKFQSLLISDKSGMKAAVYLGQEKQRLTNPIKRRSNAPDPVTNIKDGVPLTGVAGKLKKKYDAAHGKKDLQSAYDAKKAARVAGVDVSNW